MMLVNMQIKGTSQNNNGYRKRVPMKPLKCLHGLGDFYQGYGIYIKRK